MVSDGFIVTSAACGVAVFFLVHMVTFRLAKPENVLSTVMRTVAGVMGLQTVCVALWIFVVLKTSIIVGLCAVALSVLLYGLAVFFYVIWIFGPYETSVRYRVLRELALAPGGLALNELLDRYNGRTILDTRLSRLTAAGDVYRRGDVLVVARKVNAFFLLDTAAGCLRRFMAARKDDHGA